MNTNRGLFIVLEGGDGSGKSTQARLLAEALQGRGIDVLLTQEPAGTRLGELIKGVFERSHSDGGAPPISAETELFLFEAARSDHVRTVIRPALAEGRVVVCDRFADSTLAYQGYGRGLPLDEIRRLNDIATEGLTPDLVIVVDVAPEVGTGRADAGGGKKRDSIGQESLEFHRRVREGFLEIARSGGDRYVVVDAGKAVDEVAASVLEVVEGQLGEAGRASRLNAP
ncbi:MAG TPA: dTMP kinase [Dehalococcoidia bacterium]|nr:dTMP kinase [Dehalococcoidia bacterium]